MYDFANSGYTTVVITAVFNAYFVAAVAGKAPWATFAWTAALSVSYLAVLLTAPAGRRLGRRPRRQEEAALRRRRSAACCSPRCSISPGPGTVALAIALIILSNFFFATGENLIAAFLTELADSKAMGRVSGWGWAFGYLGGLVSLGISLVYITIAQKARPSRATSSCRW